MEKKNRKTGNRNLQTNKTKKREKSKKSDFQFFRQTDRLRN